MLNLVWLGLMQFVFGHGDDAVLKSTKTLASAVNDDDNDDANDDDNDYED